MYTRWNSYGVKMKCIWFIHDIKGLWNDVKMIWHVVYEMKYKMCTSIIWCVQVYSYSDVGNKLRRKHNIDGQIFTLSLLGELWLSNDECCEAVIYETTPQVYNKHPEFIQWTFASQHLLWTGQFSHLYHYDDPTKCLFLRFCISRQAFNSVFVNVCL